MERPSQAVILAAGASTRTHPLTVDRPKPLLPLLNRPLMVHLLDQLDGLVAEDKVQGNLFDDLDREKSAKLMRVLDRVNSRTASDTLRYATAGLKQPWRTKFKKRSPRYTTRWDELLQVK